MITRPTCPTSASTPHAGEHETLVAHAAHLIAELEPHCRYTPASTSRLWTSASTIASWARAPWTRAEHTPASGSRPPGRRRARARAHAGRRRQARGGAWTPASSSRSRHGPHGPPGRRAWSRHSWTSASTITSREPGPWTRAEHTPASGSRAHAPGPRTSASWEPGQLVSAAHPVAELAHDHAAHCARRRRPPT
jgi:hypothetical protein